MNGNGKLYVLKDDYPTEINQTTCSVLLPQTKDYRGYEANALAYVEGYYVVGGHEWCPTDTFNRPTIALINKDRLEREYACIGRTSTTMPGMAAKIDSIAVSGHTVVTYSTPRKAQ